ncbi:MAG: hypothetical protein U1F15_12425 [Burkholderiales bacterium]
MSPQELASRVARDASDVVAAARPFPRLAYAALIVSSVVLGFEVFRG